MSIGNLNLHIAVFIGLLYGIGEFVEWLNRSGTQSDRDNVDEAEAARRAYVDGDISESELERRLALALDEDRQELRRRVEEVSGVGPDTSAAIAHEFRSATELADTPTDEVSRRVHGVGASTAEAVRKVVE